MEATTLRDRGYHVAVICPTGKQHQEPYEEIDGIQIHRHPLPEEVSSATGYLREYACALFWQWKLTRRIWRQSPGRAFDVIQLCNPPDLMFLIAWWYKLRHRVKVIFDHHDLCPELYQAKYNKRGLFYWALVIAERLTFSTADVVISTNQSYKDIAIKRGNKRPDKVFVVRSGPNLDNFKPVPPNEQHRAGKRHLVAYLGVMGEQEGIENLLHAAQHITQKLDRTDTHFMLIGDGPAVPRLKELALSLGLSNHVEFTGRVSDEEMIQRLSSADLCVDPGPKTPFNDKSTMNKIMEYMALGKPIVQFDVLEGRRSADQASLYARHPDPIDFAEKITHLLDNPDKCQKMGQIGLARMQKHLDWSHQATRLLHAYQHALHPQNQQSLTNPPARDTVTVSLEQTCT